jgi:hypothetical protein
MELLKLRNLKSELFPKSQLGILTLFNLVCLCNYCFSLDDALSNFINDQESRDFIVFEAV